MSERPADHRIDPEQLLTVADVAAHIGAHESTVRGWIKQGELKAAKFSTRIGYRIRRADYDNFLRRRRVTSAITNHLRGSVSPVRDQAMEPVSSLNRTPQR
jgi:excisionase family DNA binding protein